jgi:pSer/pThr/pTyr-binding forkhead associated (FHA) protein
MGGQSFRQVVNVGECMKAGALQFLENGRVIDVAVCWLDITLIGREFGDILLGDEEASAEHCQIQRSGNTYHLIDLNSTNGTYLNGKRIAKAKLAEGDVIAIGKLSLRFVCVHVPSVSEPQEVIEAMRAALPLPGGSSGQLVAEIESARREQLSKARLVLEVVYGDGERQVLRFPEGKAQLGRETQVGKFRADKELSKRHATVTLERGVLKLQDHKSTNGTFLNEERVGSSIALVLPGDTIRIGRTRIWCKPDISVS